MIANSPSDQNKIPPPWATAPKPVLPPNAPTAGYLCGGGGIMTAGFETAGIRSLWNIDHDNSDPKLSQAIAQIYQTNFHHPVIRQTLQKVAASGRFNDLPTPNILVLTQPCKHLSKSNPKAKETQSEGAGVQRSRGAGVQGCRGENY
ncbi:DNA cytosine methyltransferase [Aerosakkonema funiforme]|uniref:DNA cytosine methyltransferase n=1 Tax=Aerosakkonema funiforme TaxID=1246630 RepID=UPI0035B92A06